MSVELCVALVVVGIVSGYIFGFNQGHSSGRSHVLEAWNTSLQNNVFLVAEKAAEIGNKKEGCK
jgi:hypothetical protein